MQDYISPARTATVDQLPPHDDYAEAAALGCVLCANGEAPELFSQLTSDDFYDARHREVFSALRYLHLDGKPLDCVRLVQWLKDKNRIEEAGGFSYVADLPNQVPSEAAFPTFLETVKDRAIRRAALRDCAEVSRFAVDISVPCSAITDAARRLAQAHAQGTEPSRAFRFNPDIKPPPLRAVFTLAGTPISTPGNITAFTAAPKAGKTAVIGSMMAATMPHGEGVDLLGFDSANPEGKAVILVDSEQSHDDFWNCIERTYRRAGLQAPPPWLHAYCVTGLGWKRGWEEVLGAIRSATDECAGIHSIFLDGAADFVADVNDPAESNAFVATLHGLAIKHDCPIVGVIHFNPGSEKSRGHLGSQLERKAESNLALEKDADGTTVIYSAKNRRASIPKDTGPRFVWSNAAGMHVTTESRRMAKDAAEREESLCLARDAFNGRPSMRYTDLQVTVKKLLTVSDRTAERKVARMKALTVIKPSAAGLFTIVMPAYSK
jgi:hypothetical protein